MNSSTDGTTDDGELSNRLAQIEARLGAVEQALSALSAQRAVPPPPPPDATPIVAVPPPPGPWADRPPGAGPRGRSRRPTPTVTAESALRWAGVVLVVLAALFLVSTAISRGWIGPRVQLALATVGGASLLGTGLHLDRRWGGDRRPWSLALTNTGVVVLGVCAGAAHGWLDLVTVGTAVAFVVAVLGVALAVADWFEHQSLAVSGLAVGLFVPGFIGAYEDFGDVGTGAWLLLLVVVTMMLAGRYEWSTPRLLGLAVVGPFMVVLTQGFVDVSDPLLAVIQAMIVVAGLLWWLAPWIRPAEASLRPVDHRLVFVVPGLVWLSSSGLWADTDDERSLVAIVIAAGFAVATGALWTVRDGTGSVPPLDRQLVLGHVVGVSSLVTAALALRFDGPALLAALVLQALGTVVLAVRTRDRFLDLNAALLVGAVGAWTADGLVEGIDVGVNATTGVVYLLAIVATGVTAWLIRHRDSAVAAAVAVTAWIGLLAWVMAVLRPLPQGQMLVSFVWTLFGVGPVLVGIGVVPLEVARLSNAPARWHTQVKSLGLATLAATVVKLITIDLAEVDTIWRALLFAVVGVGLLRLGYRIGLLERSDA